MRRFFYFVQLAALLALAGCAHSSGQSWEDMKTAGHYMRKGVDALWGKDYESRMLTSDEEFIGPYDSDFIPLNDADLRFGMSDIACPQPRGTLGQKGVPAFEQFYEPPADLLSLFHPLHFDTDDHIVRDKADTAMLIKLADYLKKHPQIYVVVQGHTDERASASYNMALGMRRANYVRSFLIKQGVNLDRIYTVSKGKEHPLALGHTPEDWKMNRRSEFRIYEK
jgi:peptidoglycan-associated lipoprotein